jgi:hypothetical protein
MSCVRSHSHFHLSPSTYFTAVQLVSKRVRVSLTQHFLYTVLPINHKVSFEFCNSIVCPHDMWISSVHFMRLHCLLGWSRGNIGSLPWEALWVAVDIGGDVFLQWAVVSSGWDPIMACRFSSHSPLAGMLSLPVVAPGVPDAPQVVVLWFSYVEFSPFFYYYSFHALLNYLSYKNQLNAQHTNASLHLKLKT